jgi:RES domain-containing protein
MRLWRLSLSSSARTAFDGEGARLYPGRWNTAQAPVVYASQSLSLAALEILVHAEIHQLKRPYHAFHVDVPDDLVEEVPVGKLPPGWNNLTVKDRSQLFGVAWALSLRSLALLVPSIVIPSERNALLNPRHPRFAALEIAGPLPFSFDPRVLKIPPGKA